MDIRRHDGGESFSYGELVALSGDFYGSPKELFEEQSSVLPWLWEDKDLSDLREIFKEELTWIEDEKRGIHVGYPDNGLALAWNAKSYIELALDNVDHFGWHNVVAYCRHHTAALKLATQADREDNSDETWRRALFYNAFADHFLTDAFAAGHIRVPRMQIKKWGSDVGYSDKLAGGLSKVLHDQDGHVSTTHASGERLGDDEGLRVKNSHGIEWYTRCDGQLFIVKPGDDPLVDQPIQAVKESLVELFTARHERRMPDGEFNALHHAPFPHPDASGLSAKFKPDMPTKQFDALMDSVSWYIKIPWISSGVDAGEVHSLFEAIPELMGKLRHSVVETYGAESMLQQRLPEPYVQAFQAID